MPNLMMTSALAMRKMPGQEEESKNHNEDLEKQFKNLNKCVEKGTLHELFGQNADM